MKYSEFISGLGRENVCVDRKILAELAINEPLSFKALVDRVKQMRGTGRAVADAQSNADAR